MRKIWSYGLVLMMTSHVLWGQNADPKKNARLKVDSLKKEIKNTKNHHYGFFRSLATEVSKLDSIEAISESEKISKRLSRSNILLFKVMAHGLPAYVLYHKALYEEAIKYLKAAIAIAQKNKLIALEAEMYHDLGHVQNAIKDDNSIKSFLASYEKFLSIKKNSKAANSMYQAAFLQYRSEIPLDKQRASFQTVIRLAHPDSIYHRHIINSRTALAMIHMGRREYKDAEKELMKAMKISVARKDSAWIGILSGNFSQLYEANEEYDKALKYLETDLRLSKKNMERQSLAYVYSSFADIFFKKKNYAKAKIYYDSCRIESSYDKYRKEKTSLYKPLQQAYNGLAKVFAAQSNFAQAYKYKSLASAVKDSIHRKRFRSKINQVQSAYYLDKKKKEVLLLTKEKALNKATIQRQNFLNIATGVGLVAMLLFAVVLYRNNQERKKKNYLLESQQQEIVTQNEELHQQQEEILAQQEFVEQQNRELTRTNVQIKNSISAAKLIQEAILPYQTQLDDLLRDYFIIYRPKDVVSGDFFWLNKINKKTFLIAADCTGHGVPGAFMSLICNTLFDKIIRVWRVEDTVKILEHAQHEIQMLLRQKELGYANGMDVAVLVMEEIGENRVKVRFTGAKRPMYFITKGHKQLQEIRGDRVSIGGCPRKDKVCFTEHEVALEKGSLIYVGSDGYADQNDIKRKAYTTRRLKKFLEEVSQKPIKDQGILLEQSLEEHMRNTEQRDDIMLIGLRLS